MHGEASPDNVTVDGLFSYPVKGFRAVTHAEVNLLTSGLQHDREWMVVDSRRSPAVFLSQRECPLMARVSAVVTADDGLLLTCGDNAFSVVTPARNALIKVKVWSHETVALDAGDAASDWLAGVLAMPQGTVRLVQFHPEMRRECSLMYSGDSGAHTFFADGYPVLVTNVASLADLNVRMNRSVETAMPMNRFRPNVLITGLPAWDEDHVYALHIGDVVLKLVKPCVRCQVTTTDQVSGARLSEEPLNTLARFRNNPDLGGVTFGWNAVVVAPGRLSMADRVVVTYRF
jgi:uncharacterized protein